MRFLNFLYSQIIIICSTAPIPRNNQKGAERRRGTAEGWRVLWFWNDENNGTTTQWIPNGPASIRVPERQWHKGRSNIAASVGHTSGRGKTGENQVQFRKSCTWRDKMQCIWDYHNHLVSSRAEQRVSHRLVWPGNRCAHRHHNFGMRLCK